MAKKEKTTVRFRFEKGSTLERAVILILVVLCTITLVILHASIENQRSQYEAMRIQAAVLVESNAMYNERIDDLGSVDSVILIAMEELGLVLPDTTIFGQGNAGID